jgi:hypothetical protein
MEMLTLKNGSEVAAPLVKLTMMVLDSLMGKNPTALYELVMKCRDREHKLYGNTGEVLSSLNLLQPDGRVQDAIRDIVLSATEGEGIDMTLRSPVAAVA